jgi:hypothetical protein
VSVFLFFGIVGVMGTLLPPFPDHPLDATLLPAAGFGLLSAGVLNVNNMRDIRERRGQREAHPRWCAWALMNAKSYHTSPCDQRWPRQPGASSPHLNFLWMPTVGFSGHHDSWWMWLSLLVVVLRQPLTLLRWTTELSHVTWTLATFATAMFAVGTFFMPAHASDLDEETRIPEDLRA